MASPPGNVKAKRVRLRTNLMKVAILLMLFGPMSGLVLAGGLAGSPLAGVAVVSCALSWLVAVILIVVAVAFEPPLRGDIL